MPKRKHPKLRGDFKISESDEGRSYYPPGFLRRKEEWQIEGETKLELPEKPKDPENIRIKAGRGIERSKKPCDEIKTTDTNLNILTGVIGGVIGIISGLVIGGLYLDAYLSKKPYENNGSYKVSPVGWKIKKAIGTNYVFLDSDGNMVINECQTWLSNAKYMPDFELTDKNLDGVVDQVIYRGEWPPKCYSRKYSYNPVVFEKADTKYTKYKEQLSDLIQKAEKAWAER